MEYRSAACLGFLLLLTFPPERVSAAVPGQAVPVIRHQALDCVPASDFPSLDALIQPEASIRSAKVYFRSDKYPDFYYVEMKGAGEVFRAVLPRPTVETDRLIYYIEAIDVSFAVARTDEHDPEVKSPCRRRDPQAAYFTGDDPGIVVGATRAGASAIPPGFQIGGIAGFITAAGVASGAGGGVGAGTAAAVALGAAGATAGVLAAGGQTSSSIVSGGPATSPSTTTSPVGGASSTTSSTISTSSVGSTTTAPSTTTSPGSTTTAPSTTTTTGPGSSSTSTSSTAPQALNACFAFASLSGCRVELDATCSRGEILEYRWEFHQAPGPPILETRFSPEPFVHDWGDDQACRRAGCSFERKVKLTVVNRDRSVLSEEDVSVTCEGSSLAREPQPQIVFTSILTLDSSLEAPRGYLLLNAAALDVTETAVPTLHHLRGFSGENKVEAYTVSTRETRGLWRFDFSSTEHFVPGSIHVEEGELSLLGPQTIIFRVSGRPGERIRFSYRLSP